MALVRQIVKLSGGRLGVFSRVGQGSTFWVELRKSPSPGSSQQTIDTVIALGVGESALSILPQEQRPPLDHLDSEQTFTSLPSPESDVDVQLKVQSETVLEQTTSPDGLVQLMPRKRKAGDGPENVGCKGAGLLTPNATLTPSVAEDDVGQLSRPGTSSGPPAASVSGPTQTPVSPAEIQTTTHEEQDPAPGPKEQTQGTKSLKRVARPTHVDLPPPPELRSLSAPQKTPSPSANRLPQIDITPGLPVLVVDDDKMTRMLFQRMLGRLKCQVTTAVNGYEALQLITGDQNVSQTPAEEEHEHAFMDGDDHASLFENGREREEKESKYAIVFLDNQMPVMSGVEMVRRLRTLGRKDLVVGVTGALFFIFSLTRLIIRYL